MSNAWLVFSATLTARQQALRVKVWRRLAAVGAVQLKNSLWLLPERDSCREQLFWLAQEVEAEGGEAVVLECAGLGGISDQEARDMLRRSRDADYAELEQEAAGFSARLAAEPDDEPLRREARSFVRKARRRLAAIREIDYFPSGRGEALALVVESLGARAEGQDRDEPARFRAEDFAGRVWVTRERPYIDRLASFWLVRRRIDPGAQIRFLEDGEPVPREGWVVTFDMPSGDFTHRGPLVSFEVLAQDFAIGDPAVRRLTGLVRAIDLAGDPREEGEAAGEGGLPAEARAVKDVLDGLVKISKDDAELLERAMLLFDALAASYTP